jgi:S-adenosylmethionine:tRNA ribosyltransferase-isomerase
MEEIDLKEYDYELPDKFIAQYPLNERDKSNLLVFRNKFISKDIFSNLCNYIPSGSLLVFNNTRVIKARLLFKKESGAAIEVLCLEPFNPVDYQLSFSSKEPVIWKCIIGNLKKWKKGTLKMSFTCKGNEYILSAEKSEPDGEAWRVKFSWNTSHISFGEVIEASGHIPLPPYINRKDEKDDQVRYQTVYSSINGSVAAPTAGLHFTDKVLNKISTKGIKSVELTLHVGAGTFKPIKSENISDHEMHSEQFYVTKEVIDTLLKHSGNIIPVGTTSVRTLESLYWLGVKIIKNHFDDMCQVLTLEQWEPYTIDYKNETEEDITLEESFGALLNYLKRKNTSCINATTGIIIIPGYKFRVINAMITNFHQPRSTLLLLISAWTGNDWKKIYRYAMDNNFRFLSYGDSSLLFR